MKIDIDSFHGKKKQNQSLGKSFQSSDEKLNKVKGEMESIG